MKFYLPTELYLEKDCIKKYGSCLKTLGSHAFIMTGHSSYANGSLDDTAAKLDELGIKYAIFDKTGENPSVETIMTAKEAAVKCGADFVIGVGGGSPLDAAKAVALMAKNPESGPEVLYSDIKLEHLPVAEVPTTAGTGSEVTQYSILTRHEKRTKKSISHSIFPVYAFDDPKYLATLLHSTLKNTAADTLAHLIESYFSARSENSVFCEKGLMLWGSLKNKIRGNTLSEKDRETLMLTSALGGMAIAHTSTSLPHGLSYKVTYELGIPHGKACGMFLGGYVQHYPDRSKAENVLSLLGFETSAELKAFLADMLDQEPLDKAFALENAKALTENADKLKNHPFAITAEELLELENTYERE